MKSFSLILFSLLFGSNANAVVFGDIAETGVKQVKGYIEPNLHGIELLRSEHGLVVKAEFMLNGCLNDLTPVAQSLVETENELIIILSTLEIEVQSSEQVKCIQANLKETKVFVPSPSLLD